MISVTEIWPPVSSLRSSTSVRRSAAEDIVVLLSGSGGLEELDRVAGGVFEHDLLAAGSADDVVAELHAGGAQPLDFGGDVLDDEVNAVPTAGLGCAAVGHRAPGRALRAAEQQA